jgi:transposase
VADPRDNLVPFTGADDPRRQNGRGRPSRLNDPGFIDLFAALVVSGATNEEIAQQCEISDRSVRNYKKDPRVKAAAIKLTEDRILRITRKVDSEIEQRLQHPNEIPTDELIKLRKEYLPGFVRQQVDAQADAATIEEVMTEIEDDPELAEKLRELVGAKD